MEGEPVDEAAAEEAAAAAVPTEDEEQQPSVNAIPARFNLQIAGFERSGRRTRNKR